jgi:hypothetical protein
MSERPETAPASDRLIIATEKRGAGGRETSSRDEESCLKKVTTNTQMRNEPNKGSFYTKDLDKSSQQQTGCLHEIQTWLPPTAQVAGAVR